MKDRGVSSSKSWFRMSARARSHYSEVTSVDRCAKSSQDSDAKKSQDCFSCKLQIIQTPNCSFVVGEMVLYTL